MNTVCLELSLRQKPIIEATFFMGWRHAEKAGDEQEAVMYF